MALCTGPLLINERNRWREMSDRQLFQRLQKITKPEKLSCFLLVATDLNRGTLFRDGIDRCEALGFGAIERGDGWWDVVVADRYNVDRDQDGRIESITRGPAGQALREALESTGLMPSNEVIEEILESKKPKKKKSIYSRKLRTRRRK